MEYNGYKTKITYDEELDVLRGRVMNIRDVITFQGKSVEELRANLEKTIDEYIQLCEEIEREPDKVYSGKFVVRLSPELHRDASELALAKDMSLNNLVTLALQSYVNQELSARSQQVPMMSWGRSFSGQAVSPVGEWFVELPDIPDSYEILRRTAGRPLNPLRTPLTITPRSRK